MTASLFSLHRWQLTLLGSLLSTGLVTGCGGAPTALSPAADRAEAPAMEANKAGGTTAMEATVPATQSAAVTAPGTSNAIPQAAPQLVKRADLSLIVGDVNQSVATVTQMTRQLQGDLLNLQDWQPQQTQTPRQVSLTLRIPQQNLDAALEQLRQLGDIQQQSVTAEDVSDQLVDLAARIRNLRQSETALLKIMDRSGKISEVLEVSRELSSVRESIERLDAQQQQLKRQVAYSTINLNLTSAIATPVNPRPLGETLGTSWQAATQSVGDLTTGLLKISLWLLAYSPYLALIAAIAFWGYRLRQQPRRQEPVEGE